MTRDDNKGISIGRDGLDLPADIRFDLGGASTTYRRWADGTLFRVESSDRRGLVARSTRIGPVRHERDGSAVVAHAEGRDIRADGRWTREYDLRDHLGNTRATFADSDSDGLPELLQEDHYYPFGARMAGKGLAAPGGGPAALGAAPHDNRFLYNGKELQADFGLGLYDYGARFYDPVLGRWDAPDPLAEQRNWASPYNYLQNNPMNRIDPDGRLDDWYQAEDGQLLWKEGTEENVTIASKVSPDGRILETKSFAWIANDGEVFSHDGAAVAITGASEASWERDIINIAENSPGTTVLAIGDGLKAMENATKSFGLVRGVAMRDHSSNAGYAVHNVFGTKDFVSFKEKLSSLDIRIAPGAEFFFMGCSNGPLAQEFSNSFLITSTGSFNGTVGPLNSTGAFHTPENGSYFAAYKKQAIGGWIDGISPMKTNYIIYEENIGNEVSVKFY